MKKWVVAGLGLVIAFFAYSGWYFYAPPSEKYMANNEREVQEALLLILLESWSASYSMTVSVGDLPIPDKMLSRIQKQFPETEVSRDIELVLGGGLITTDTHEPAASLHVGKVTWHSRGVASVRAFGFCGELCGESATYTLTKVGGSWRVTDESDLEVS